MAQLALEKRLAHDARSDFNSANPDFDHSLLSPKTNDSEFNVTSQSTFAICLMVGTVAVPIWGAISFILMR